LYGQLIVGSSNIEQRLKEDTLSAGITVEKFIEKIQEQCKEVYDRHDKISVEEFQRTGMYRILEMEMVDVKV
jgi:hypothetical protein